MTERWSILTMKFGLLPIIFVYCFGQLCLKYLKLLGCINLLVIGLLWVLLNWSHPRTKVCLLWLLAISVLMRVLISGLIINLFLGLFYMWVSVISILRLYSFCMTRLLRSLLPWHGCCWLIFFLGLFMDFIVA